MRLIRVVPATGMLVAICALLILTAGSSRAAAADAPFKLDFDSSKIQVGALADLPLDALSTTASLEGTIDENGAVTIPKGKFKLPELGITEPVAIKGFMGIESPATGNFNAATGQLDLDAQAGLWVSVNLKQLLDAAGGLNIDLDSQLGGLGPMIGLIGNLTCGFSPMDVHFSTEGTSLAGGQRFTAGPTGPGAISAEWSQLGPFAGRSGLSTVGCPLVKDMLPGLLSGLAGSTGTETGGLDLGGLLDGLDLTQLDNLNLGPSGITLIRTTNEPVIVDPPDTDPTDVVDPPAPAKLKLLVTPKQRKAKRGSSIRYRATVRNLGGAASKRVKICIKAPKKAAKVKRCRNLGSIAAGTSKRGFFRLKLKPKANKRVYRIGFKIRSGAPVKPGTSTRLRVR